MKEGRRKKEEKEGEKTGSRKGGRGAERKGQGVRDGRQGRETFDGRKICVTGVQMGLTPGSEGNPHSPSICRLEHGWKAPKVYSSWKTNDDRAA